MTQEAAFTIVTNFQHNAVVLVQRKDVPVWVLPGGGIDPNESSEVAAKRELFEETHLKAECMIHIATYLPVNIFSQKTDIFITFFSNVTLVNYPFSGDPNECAKISFFPLDNLPKNLFPIHKIWITENIELAQNPSKTIPFTRNLDEASYSSLIQTLFLHPILSFQYLLKCLYRLCVKNIKRVFSAD